MSDLEDRLADLRPIPAPPHLWERVRRNEPAPVRRARLLPKDAPLWAAAAGLLFTLYAVLSWTPEPAAPSAAPGAAFPQEPSAEILERLRDYPHRILFESNREGNWE